LRGTLITKLGITLGRVMKKEACHDSDGEKAMENAIENKSASTYGC
jgi:hypothetical protein